MAKDTPDTFFRMRRASHSGAGHPPAAPGTTQEPLIVVEESETCEKADETSAQSSQRQSLDIDSPENPYLLSPWREARETRKHSLPTPPCTSGITASQVRRLSERGGEGSGPSPREQAFLATLCSTPAPQPGGRRHSVVTISRVPPTMFGRSRRESIAAVPTGQRPGTGHSRRESGSGPPPSTDHRGSVHNLQLDIMDDIVQARKARMKLWNTSNERVCEVQTLDEAGTGSSSPMRYTNRRYSDFVGTALPPIQSFRRASELPVSPLAEPPEATGATGKPAKMGIVCTNTDLISLLSSLASSATEINRCGEKDSSPASTSASASGQAAAPPPPGGQPLRPFPSLKSLLKVPPATGGTSAQEPPGDKLRCKNRSNSFDSSLYHSIKQLATGGGGAVSPGGTDPAERPTVEAGWFTKRHQPIGARRKSASQTAAGFAGEAFERLRRESRGLLEAATVGASSTAKSTAAAAAAATAPSEPRPAHPPKPTGSHRSPLNKLKWDGRSAIVDARMIGHAIENFITGSGSSSSAPSPSGSGGASKKGDSAAAAKKSSGAGASSTTGAGNWFGKTAADDEESADTCDSSLCSTLKDLFVK
ncbi:uncharacterized protein LOC128266871 [Anopheles cruzii]|uniref:uncharacterized protein LOC128266871 n=1 Tax=Anopheles cruzii TaxID=68878 RepID=UPI0022EC835B|nr:uncharacterized protein LOC128266871 [Anopheles cruzii]